jgi:hypothetical protein
MNTVPLWEKETKIMPTPVPITGRLPETGILLLSVRQLARLAASLNKTDTTQPTMTERCASRLWRAMAEYNLRPHARLPLEMGHAMMKLYYALKDGDEAAQFVALARMVDTLVNSEQRWIACSQGVDEALGQAERFLSLALEAQP